MKFDIDEHKAAMGVDWPITPRELSEAIPPYFTQWIRHQLLKLHVPPELWKE